MSAPLLHLPGQGFTVWTRSLVPPPRVAPAVVASATASVATDPTEASASSKSWLSRAAWLAVPFLGALWYSDHQRQSTQAAELSKAYLADEELKTKFQNQASFLSQELSNQVGQLETAEAKQRDLTLAVGRLKTALTGMEEDLRAKTLLAQAAVEKATAQEQEMAAVKSGFGAKESAWNNSLAVLKTEALQAKQTLEQRELEMKDQLAKVDAERALAQKEAAAAAAKSTEMAGQLEALQKKPPVAPAPVK